MSASHRGDEKLLEKTINSTPFTASDSRWLPRCPQPLRQLPWDRRCAARAPPSHANLHKINSKPKLCMKNNGLLLFFQAEISSASESIVISAFGFPQNRGNPKNEFWAKNRRGPNKKKMKIGPRSPLGQPDFRSPKEKNHKNRTSAPLGKKNKNTKANAFIFFIFLPREAAGGAATSASQLITITSFSLRAKRAS